MGFAHFDEMCWPVPDERTAEVSARLTWNEPQVLTREDRLIAAGIVEAYKALVALPAHVRQRVVREIRAAQRKQREVTP